MSERSWEEAVTETEQLLGQFEPAAGSINSARIMYEAGRRAGQAASHRGQRFAYAVSLVLLLLLVVSTSGLIYQLKLSSPIAELQDAVPFVEPESSGADDEATPGAPVRREGTLQAQRELAYQFGADRLPAGHHRSVDAGRTSYGRLRVGLLDGSGSP